MQDLVNQKDAFGVSYTPDFGNIMSYNNRSCREHFTPGQYSKMFSYSRIKPRAYERFIPSNWAIRNMDALNILNNKVYVVVLFARWMAAPKYYHSEGIVVSNSVIDNSQGIHFKANNFVKLTNGFAVKNNSSLKIEIGPNCASPAPPAMFRVAQDLDLKNGEAVSDIQCRVFPNPVSQYLNIEVEGILPNGFRVSLVNVLGEKVLTKDFRSTNEKSSGLSLEGLPKGYYNVLFESGDKVMSQPLIVQ